MWNKIKAEFDKNENKYNKKANIALIVGVLSLVLAPIFLTQFSWKFDFTKTGEIGDTIGGTATPILTFIGAILVYYSFKQQMAANRIQIDALLDEKKDKKETQIVEFCHRIQNEIIEKISQQEVKIPRFGAKINYTTYKAGIAISNTLIKLDETPDVKDIDQHYQKCLASITIIFRNVKLLLNYIDKIEDKTIQEMLFNSYYNNLHLELYIDRTENYLLRKSHSLKEHNLVKLCISTEEVFARLDAKYKVQNKWLTYPQN